MPLRDHFRPPFIQRASWEEVHGGWPMVIVQQLVRILPAQYVAAPRVHLGSQAEIDVAALELGTRDIEPMTPAGGIATLWAPAQPNLALETELADTDEYEVRVYDIRRDRRLVAAVELISPANKDRPEARAQFVSKCASLLRQSVAVVLVDVITSRSANLYAELLDWVDGRDPSLGEEPSAIYAAACRWQPRGAKRWLEAWSQPLVVGQPLPVLPLWLSEELAVPLDLEASYEQTCRDLRIE
jgi:Protein of unknown function (DUF4058)